jgi:hypothetical protein
MITKYEIYLSTDKFDQKRQAVLNRDSKEGHKIQQPMDFKVVQPGKARSKT